MGDRPTWRYVWWNGWNYLAMAWMLVGGATAAVASGVLASWDLTTNRHHGAVTIVAGLAILLADIVCRLWDRQATGVSRFISPHAGGAVLAIPSWLIAVGIVGTGIAVLFGTDA